MELTTNEIKSISSKYDEFNDDKIILSLKRLHEDILQKDGELHYYRDIVRGIENELKKMRSEFNEKSTLYNIEYKTRSVDIVKSDSFGPLVFKNGRILKG